MSKVSIILPVYNTELFLNKCLDSIINQTYSNLEIICINDGSTDNSLEILKTYKEKDKRIQVINITNHGVSYARNLGLTKITGEFVVFIDSDDYIESDYIQCLIENQKEKDTDLVYCGHYTRTPEGIIKHKWLPKCTFSKDPIRDKEKITRYLVVTKKLFKTSIIKENSLNFDITLHYAEDSLFLIQYLLLCKTTSGVLKYLYNDVVNSKSLCRNTAFKERRVIERKKSFDKINKLISNYICKTSSPTIITKRKKEKYF